MLAGTGARAGVAPSSVLRVSLEERFDEGALAAGEAPGGSQLMTRVSPELVLRLRGRTFGLSGSYSPNILVRHGSGTTTLDHRLDLEVEKRWSGTFALGAGVVAWRVSDPTSLPRLEMARSQEPVLYWRASTRAQLELSRRWQLRSTYAFEEVRLQAKGRVPGLLHQPGTELTYRITRRSTLGLEYRAQFFLFGQDAAAAHHLGAQWFYRLTRTARLEVRGGPVWFREATGAGGLRARLSFGLTQDARPFDWGVSLGHDLMGASGLDAARWVDVASATAGWSASRTVRGFAVASAFRNGRAPGVGVLSGTGEDRVTQGYGLGAGVDWRLHRALVLRGSVSRLQQLGAEDPVAAGTMTHNIVSVRALLTAWE